MTPTLPQHCNHECVCHLFLQNCFTGDSPCLEPCKDDSRSHITTPFECEQDVIINCCNCGVPKMDDGEPNCNDCVFSEQHDKDVQDEILNNFAQWVKTEWVREAIKDYKVELWKEGELSDQPCLVPCEPCCCDDCPCPDTEMELYKPRCLMNHHGDDGKLVEYLGSGKPCLGCEKREECFDIFYKYKRHLDEDAP